MSEEIKVGQEVLYKAISLWHRAIVIAIYEKPGAIKVQNRINMKEYLLRPRDIETDLRAEDISGVARVPKRRTKKTKQLEMF